MKLSNYFWQTYKEKPVDAEIASHILMMRAGLIYKSGAGLYSYLPMGLKVIQKVEQIVRESMNEAGCFELTMSMVTPGELWKESGRWDIMSEMLKAKDKNDKDICLSPTNEETVTDIFRKTIFSYKQLPVTLYQINTKYRDEIRPRFGLMRCREFIMKDAYSFHETKESLAKTYEKLHSAYCSIFEKMGLLYFPVEADAGAMASSENRTHEFQVIAESGEDEIIFSEEANYAANIEKAKTNRGALAFEKNDENAQLVETPNKATIEDVCKFLKVEEYKSLKSLVYYYNKEEKDHYVLVLLLGDDKLNELKLKNYLDVEVFRPATDNELSSLGLIKGFIGPHELKADLNILFDELVDIDASYTVGANIENYHFKNFKASRDLKEVVKVDLRLSKAGDLTTCGKVVEIKRGIEVGHIFELGTKYTESMDTKVLNEAGKSIHPLMGCYGLGVTRTIAAAIEQSHDENGIIWPKAIAPYQVHFVAIAKSDEAKEIAEQIYKDLKEDFDVLYDDRKVGPGFKFKDADLLGLPLQVTFGERDFKTSGELKIKFRKSGESIQVKKEDLVKELKVAWEKA